MQEWRHPFIFTWCCFVVAIACMAVASGRSDSKWKARCAYVAAFAAYGVCVGAAAMLLNYFVLWSACLAVAVSVSAGLIVLGIARCLAA